MRTKHLEFDNAEKYSCLSANNWTQKKIRLFADLKDEKKK